MEIKDRIKIIMEKENMASGAFAESIGIQQSTLSHGCYYESTSEI